MNATETLLPEAEMTTPPVTQADKHTGLGIASFVLSIIAIILIFGLLIVAGIIEASTPGGMNEQSAEAIIVGMLLFAFIGLAMVAAGLGIAGLFQKQRKKIFAILGTVFSSVSVLGTLALIAFGMTID